MTASYFRLEILELSANVFVQWIYFQLWYGSYLALEIFLIILNKPLNFYYTFLTRKIFFWVVVLREHFVNWTYTDFCCGICPLVIDNTYMILCRYPMSSKKDFELACAVCKGNCNCIRCLRLENSLPVCLFKTFPIFMTYRDSKMSISSIVIFCYFCWFFRRQQDWNSWSYAV